MTAKDPKKLISALFDYQRFAANSRLKKIITDTIEGGGELEDDDLEWVNAAGEENIYLSDPQDGEKPL